jgi:hypothetical protein
MSLYEQVMQVQADAKQSQHHHEHDDTVLTDHDHEVLTDIYDIVCHDNHRPSILKAATSNNYYILYRGSELTCLNHLKANVRTNIVKELQSDILRHYGGRFSIRYSDETYGGEHSAVAGLNAELCLHWPAHY